MTLGRIFYNQVGYLSDGPKGVTVACDATEPVHWRLLAASPDVADLNTDTGTFSVAGVGGGAGYDLSAYGIGEFDDAAAEANIELSDADFADQVAEGSTVPRGLDPTAGFAVHTLDFTDVQMPGTYLLQVDDGTDTVSAQLKIGDQVYEAVLRDALRFFTLQRSGMEIKPSFAGPAYARAAGHLDVAPNQGDSHVCPLPAGAATTADGVDLYDGWSGDYLVDARGGWYDAGDMGKYVVNGGIATAQLLSIVERALISGVPLTPGSPATIALDEARWELDWMRRMQVAPGLPYAGMVHHKIADEHWTPIPTLPADDPQPRYVHRPSTAATLNFAAVAAQGARVFRNTGWPGDSKFAKDLLTAARLAYDAAKAHPELYAPDTNLLANPGSGPYNDTELCDEWYWAQGCLFLSTGEQKYLDDLRANPFHFGRERSPWSEVGFDWRDTAAWARMQLALNELPENASFQARQGLKAELRDAAEALIAQQQPFGHLYAPADGRYAWGSNGMIANNAAIAAAAYLESGDEAYRYAAISSLDYLFGRNALGISYVTGYGKNYAQNQHSRWYTAQKDPALPHPPPGTISGGPNSDCPDPVSAPLAGRPAQLCFVDDIDSWGTNELTINWNAALAWLLAFAVSS